MISKLETKFDLNWIRKKANGSSRNNKPNGGISRNLVGNIFPYAAVMHSSGCKAFKFDKKSSCMKRIQYMKNKSQTLEKNQERKK